MEPVRPNDTTRVPSQAVALPKVATQIEGLDEILHGGLIPGRAYLIRGGPGTGKTTLGLQFLRAGVDRDEGALFLTLDSSTEYRGGFL